MTTYTDETVSNLVINKLTKAQYEAIQNPSDTELYIVEDATLSYNDLSDKPVVDQTYDGTSANAQSGVAINGAGFIKNTATGTNAITILGTPTNNLNAIGIGINSNAAPSGSVAIGNDQVFTSVQNGEYIAIGDEISINVPSGGGRGVIVGNGSSVTGTSAYNIVVGGDSTSQGTYSIVIGANSHAVGNDAIQLGYGSNYKANSFKVGTRNNSSNQSENYELLDLSNGKIPDDRLNTTIARTSDYYTKAEVDAMIGNIEAILQRLNSGNNS